MTITKTYTIFSLLALALFSSCANGEKRNENKEVVNIENDDLRYPHELLESFEDRPFMFYNVENLFDTINDPETLDDDFLPDSEKQWTQKRYNDKLEKLAAVLTHRSEEHTSELQSRPHLVCRLLLEKK